MKEKGMSIMIGLLGKEPKMSEKSEGGLLESNTESCPLATQDMDINKGNRKKAIITASYGEVEDGEGKCKACEYFNTELSDCGVKKGDGYCEIFDFVCNQENGCMAWEAMDNEDEEMEED
jgi:hypothetical protein